MLFKSSCRFSLASICTQRAKVISIVVFSGHISFSPPHRAHPLLCSLSLSTNRFKDPFLLIINEVVNIITNSPFGSLVQNAIMIKWKVVSLSIGGKRCFFYYSRSARLRESAPSVVSTRLSVQFPGYQMLLIPGAVRRVSCVHAAGF